MKIFKAMKLAFFPAGFSFPPVILSIIIKFAVGGETRRRLSQVDALSLRKKAAHLLRPKLKSTFYFLKAHIGINMVNVSLDTYENM